MSDLAIAARGLHKYFGTLHALRGIDLEVEPGEFFGLLGPNGAGKSTLINLMAGLLRPSKGTVAIQGYDVTRDYRRARQSLGLVPQELAYDPFFTVREIMRIQAGYFGQGAAGRAWIEELLEVLSLTDKADTNVQRLSGGMKRRVLIAQALVHRPAVVILDEPTAGVDIDLRQALWNFTQRLHNEGKTIVLTTHYLGEAEARCGRIAILNHGEIVALDSKEALLARFPYRWLVVSISPAAVSLPTALEEHLVSRDQHSLTFKIHRQQESAGAVLDALRTAGIRVLDLQTRDPGLEEVFLSLTTTKQSSANSIR